jgi:hypothetical protein
VSETEGASVKNAEYKNGSWSRTNKKGVRFGVKVKDVLASQLIATATDAQTGMRKSTQQKPGSRHSVTLRDDIANLSKILPTPTLGGFDDTNARAIKKGQLHAIHGKETGLKLHPNFAAWMMGYPEDWAKLP